MERRLKAKAGIKTADIFTRKLKSPAAIEKLKGIGDTKKKRDAWVERYCHKPEGQLTVVPDRDPLDSELPSALTDFEAIPDKVEPNIEDML